MAAVTLGPAVGMGMVMMGLSERKGRTEDRNHRFIYFSKPSIPLSSTRKTISHFFFRTCLEIPNINHINDARVSHGLVCAVRHQIPGVCEDAGPDGGLGVDPGLLFPAVDVPESARVVGGSGQEVLGLPVHIQAPHGTAVALSVAVVTTAKSA